MTEQKEQKTVLSFGSLFSAFTRLKRSLLFSARVFDRSLVSLVISGIPQGKAAYLLSMIGITNTVGRVLCGWVSDHPRVNALAINNAALVVGGAIT